MTFGSAALSSFFLERTMCSPTTSYSMHMGMSLSRRSVTFLDRHWAAVSVAHHFNESSNFTGRAHDTDTVSNSSLSNM